MVNYSMNKMSIPGTKPQNVSLTHIYTCNSCQVAFRSTDSQREHMRSDWHRYNLKRRVISLPPISSEIFTKKALQAHAHSTAVASKATFEKTCTLCERTYFSENAFLNHEGSQRHKAKLASASVNEIKIPSVIGSFFSLGEPVIHPKEVESNEDQIINTNENPKGPRPESQKYVSQQLQISRAFSKHNHVKTDSPISVTDRESNSITDLSQCLFCNRNSETLELNSCHMEKIHGLFLPERQYLTDIEGLIKFLHQKIHKYHQCLYCGKFKTSVFGLQTHMRDKGHCNIPFFSEAEQLEIGEFYDFTSTYSDFEEDSDLESSSKNQTSSINLKLGPKREEKSLTVNEGVADTDDGWETDGSELSTYSKTSRNQISHQTESLGELIHQTQSNLHLKSIDENHKSYIHKHKNTVLFSDNELHLPSGKIAGHRSLNKYFKQNLHNYPSQLEKLENLRIKDINNPNCNEDDRTVAIGNGKGLFKKITTRKNNDGKIAGVTEEKIGHVVALEIRSRQLEQRNYRRKEWLISKQKNSQKHFRDPLLQ